jgi:hypothetical protein
MRDNQRFLLFLDFFRNLKKILDKPLIFKIMEPIQSKAGVPKDPKSWILKQPQFIRALKCAVLGCGV